MNEIRNEDDAEMEQLVVAPDRKEGQHRVCKVFVDENNHYNVKLEAEECTFWHLSHKVSQLHRLATASVKPYSFRLCADGHYLGDNDEVPPTGGRYAAVTVGPFARLDAQLWETIIRFLLPDIQGLGRLGQVSFSNPHTFQHSCTPAF